MRKQGGAFGKWNKRLRQPSDRTNEKSEDEMKHGSVLLTFLGLLLAFSLLLTACGPAQVPAQDQEAPEESAPTDEPVAAEPVTISYWHTMSDPETAQLEEVISAFEAANPSITVDATRYAYDDFKPALLTSLAGGEAPDTARMGV
jgi:ABC-type glycerol-3-phosphate transport system substrate-binding protein